MKITALLMAGGKGTRMKLGVEKPMLKLGGKPLIEYVLDALMRSKEVNDVVVAVSKYTPKTAEYLTRRSVVVIETPGESWHVDVRYAVKKMSLDKVLTVSADIPFITSEIIDEIIRGYRRSRKSAFTVVVPLETRKRLGLSANYTLRIGNKTLVPAGINVVDGKRIDDDVLEEEIFIMDDERLAININTYQDLIVARNFYKRFIGT